MNIYVLVVAPVYKGLGLVKMGNYQGYGIWGVRTGRIAGFVTRITCMTFRMVTVTTKF